MDDKLIPSLSNKIKKKSSIFIPKNKIKSTVDPIRTLDKSVMDTIPQDAEKAGDVETLVSRSIKPRKKSIDGRARLKAKIASSAVSMSTITDKINKAINETPMMRNHTFKSRKDDLAEAGVDSEQTSDKKILKDVRALLYNLNVNQEKSSILEDSNLSRREASFEMEQERTASLQNIEKFSSHTATKYMEQSLALKYRQTLILKDMLSISKAGYSVLENKLEAIKINTAVSEMRKRSLIDLSREQVFRSLINRTTTHIFDRIGEHLAARVGDKITEYAGKAYNSKTGKDLRKKAQSTADSARAYVKENLDTGDSTEDEDILQKGDDVGLSAADKIKNRIRKTVRTVKPTKQKRQEYAEYLRKKKEALEKSIEDFDLQKTKETIEARIKDFDAKKLKDKIRRKSSDILEDIDFYKEDIKFKAQNKFKESGLSDYVTDKTKNVRDTTRRRTSNLTEKLNKIIRDTKLPTARKYGDKFDRRKYTAKKFFGDYIQDYYKELGLDDDVVLDDENKQTLVSRLRDKLKTSKLSKEEIENKIKDLNISNLIDEKKATFKKSSIYKKYQDINKSEGLEKLRKRYKDFDLNKFKDDMKQKGSDLLEDVDFYKEDTLFKAKDKWKRSYTKDYLDKKLASIQDPEERAKFLASLNKRKDTAKEYIKENFSMDSFAERKDRFKNLFRRSGSEESEEIASGAIPFKKSINSQKLDQILTIMQTSVPVHFSHYNDQINGRQTSTPESDVIDTLKSKPRSMFNKYINKAVSAANDNIINPIKDVYKKNNVTIGKPLLSARQIREGVVFADGTSVKNVENITQPVIDPKTGNTLVTEDDLHAGIVDVNNKPVGKSIFSSVKGIGKSLVSLYKNKWLKPLGDGVKRVSKSAFDKLAPEKLKKALGPEGLTITNMKDVLADKLDKINETLKAKAKPGDTDGDGVREGSYQDKVRKLIAAPTDRSQKQDPNIRQGKSSTVATAAAIAGLLSGPKKAKEEKDASFDEEDDKESSGEGGVMSTLIGTYLASKIPGFKFLKKGKDKIKGLFKKGGKAAASAAGAAAAGIGGKAAASGAGKLGLSLAAPIVASSAGKTLTKSLIKKIPILGFLAGTAFSLDRLWQGDLVGAGLEFLSGAVSLVPFAGTAASIMIDSVLGLRDYNRLQEGSPIKKYVKTRMDFLGVEDEKAYGTVFQIEDKIYKRTFQKGPAFDTKELQTYMLDFNLDPSDEKQVGYFTGWVTMKVARSLMAHVKTLGDLGIKYEDANSMTDEQATEAQKSYLAKIGPYISKYKDLKPYKSDYDEFERRYAEKKDEQKRGDYKPTQDADFSKAKTEPKTAAAAIAAGVTAANTNKPIVAQSGNTTTGRAMNVSNRLGGSSNVIPFAIASQASNVSNKAKFKYMEGTPGSDYTKGFENIKVDDDVSSLSAGEESGKAGSYAIGFDSTGGTSYGQYQIAARTGTFSRFLAWLDAQGGNASTVAQRLRQAGNPDGGKSGAVAQEWKALAKEGLINQYEHDFIRDTHYKPAFDKLKPEIQDLVSKSKVLQKVLFSTAVQHGPGLSSGAAQIFNKVWNPNMDIPAFIRSIYQERGTRFSSSSPGVQQSVLNRFGRESRTALAMHTKEQQNTTTMTASNDNANENAPADTTASGGTASSGPTQTASSTIQNISGTAASPEASDATAQPATNNPIVAKSQETQQNATIVATNNEIEKTVATNAPKTEAVAPQQEQQVTHVSTIDPNVTKELTNINTTLSSLASSLDKNLENVVKLGQTNNNTVVAPVVASNNIKQNASSSSDDVSISMKKNGSDRYAS